MIDTHADTHAAAGDSFLQIRRTAHGLPCEDFSLLCSDMEDDSFPQSSVEVKVPEFGGPAHFFLCFLPQATAWQTAHCSILLFLQYKIGCRSL